MGIQTDPVEIKIKRATGRPRTTPFGPPPDPGPRAPRGRRPRSTNLSEAPTPLQEEILPQEISQTPKIRIPKKKKEK